MTDALKPWWLRLALSRWLHYALLVLAAWAIWQRGDMWKERFETLAHEAGVVLVAISQASDNPDVRWKSAAGQVLALGDSNRDLKQAIEVQNSTIAEMASEAVRLRAKAADMKQIADRARAQRASALRRLSDLSAPPPVRRDCELLVREANQALDMLRQEGF